jgi:hypothetical protein
VRLKKGEFFKKAIFAPRYQMEWTGVILEIGTYRMRLGIELPNPFSLEA